MANNTKAELLLSGKTDFKLQVPYKLFETGEKGTQKPLLVYLHGFAQNITEFQLDTRPLLSVHGYHLYIQAPYPIYERSGKKKVNEWGRAWYLYDGDQSQFRSSLDNASRFIRDIISRVKKIVDINRTCIIGFSMGGYLAGYHAIHTPEQVNELIMYGARFKSELLIGDYEKISHQNILALHGIDDKKVEPGPQKNEMRILREKGIDARFAEIEESHTFSPSGIEIILEWLSNKGYTSSQL